MILKLLLPSPCTVVFYETVLCEICAYVGKTLDHFHVTIK